MRLHMDEYLIDELAEIEDVIEEIEKVPYEVKDLDSANWAFRKLTALHAAANENVMLAKREIGRIEEWLARKNTGILNSISYFEGLITNYYISEKEKNSKFKLSTPYGKVIAKTTNKPFYDEELLAKELKDTEFVTFRPVIDKTELKKNVKTIECEGGFKAVTADGVILEGLTFKPQTTYSVKPETD